MNGKQELQIYREQLLSRMQNVVEDLQAAVDHLSVEQLLSPCLAGGETPHHVLAHLAVIEEYALWPRLQRIIQEEYPVLDLFNDGGWMDEHYDNRQPVKEILNRFADLRQAELNFIEHLPTSAWNRLCRHPWSGERTFQWWVELTLAYSLEHLSLLQSGES